MEFQVKVHLLHLKAVFHLASVSRVEVELAIELPVALVVEIVRASQDEVGRYQNSRTYLQGILVGAVVYEGPDRPMGEQLNFLFRHFLHSILMQTILPVVAFIIEIVTIVATVAIAATIANIRMAAQSIFIAIFAVVNVFECSCLRLRVGGNAVSHRHVVISNKIFVHHIYSI